VQLRDIRGSEKVDWPGVTRTSLPHEPDRKEWLCAGDILFAFRGTRYFALCLDNVPERAVVSPHFMLIRVQDTTRVVPAFLAWQLNQARAQAYFQKAARGTAQKSVRHADVALTSIAVPEVSFQRAVVEIDQLARRERSVYEELIEIRRLQLSEVAASVFAVADAGSSS
jgi:hypothetical protein